jgi:hypothetical protein
MPFDGRVSLVRWALRGSAVAGAGGKALRRAEMREPKCTLNLPIIIGQTPTVQAASAPNRGDRTLRFPVVMAGSRVSLFSLAAHINRSFRNDVNAGVIPFGERAAIKVSSSASKFGRPMDQPDSAHLTTRRDFLRRGGRPLRRHCARQPTRDAVPAADRKVRLQAECGKTTCRSTHECYGRLASSQEAA